MLRWASPLIVGLALAAAGCGGGSSTAETTTSTETVTQESTTTESTTTESAGTVDVSKALGDEDCIALAGVGAAIAQAYAGGSGTSDSGSADLNELASKVPEEIKGDVETIAKWYADYGAKIKDLNLQSGQLPTAEQAQKLQAALASFDQAELTAASDRISAWAKKNCSAVGG